MQSIILSLASRYALPAAEVIQEIGPIFSNYTTVGFSVLIQTDRMVEASPERILVEG